MMDNGYDMPGAGSGTIFSDLEQSYMARSQNPDRAHAAWREVLSQLPPDRLNDFSSRPSYDLARLSGDLGLALFWNAQATLIRPLMKAFLDAETEEGIHDLLSSVETTGAGALAISEDKARPLVVTQDNDSLVLDGQKRYITGGAYADFLFVTGRSPDEDQLSCMVFLPVRDIPGEMFEGLDLGCFYTTSQARLTLEGFHLPRVNLLSAEPRRIRKLLRVCGMIEQSMIMEALMGLVFYLAEVMVRSVGKGITGIGLLEESRDLLAGEIDQQIASARTGKFIEPLHITPDALTGAMQQLKSIHDDCQEKLSADLSYRFKDLFYFSSYLLPGQI